jgi:hypothetical protein
MGAHTLDLSVLSAERRQFLATLGRRLTAQALQRREPERRYPILLTLAAQSAAEVLAFARPSGERDGDADPQVRVYMYMQ